MAIATAKNMSFAPFSRFDYVAKRKRVDDDDDAQIFGQRLKRVNFASLPIRSPPLQQEPTISVTSSVSAPPGTLTPDSLHEEDFTRQKDLWGQHTRHAQSQPGVSRSPAVNDGITATEEPRMEMDDEPRTPVHHLKRIGRARSNDLMSPVKSPAILRPPHLLSPPAMKSCEDRLPTPVAMTFGRQSPFDQQFSTAAARQLRPQMLHTTLSPMVDAESWTPQVQRPLSPDPETEYRDLADSDMVMEDSVMSSSFGALSVDTFNQNLSYDDSPTRRNVGLGLDSTGSSLPAINNTTPFSHARNDSRTARLRMGFRSDCEKCIQRVPGHYAHIDWSR